jgi:hypothetical protein
MDFQKPSGKFSYNPFKSKQLQERDVNRFAGEELLNKFAVTPAQAPMHQRLDPQSIGYQFGLTDPSARLTADRQTVQAAKEHKRRESWDENTKLSASETKNPMQWRVS